MTDAPERIWAWQETDPLTDKKWGAGQWYTKDIGLDGDEIDQLFIEEINDKQIKFKDPHKLAEKETLLIDWNNGTKSEYIIKKTITPLIIELIENPNQNKNEYIKIIRKKNTKIINNITNGQKIIIIKNLLYIFIN